MEHFIPIVLFTYNRPDHLLRLLECLRINQVPLIYAFSDGPLTPENIQSVNRVRSILKSIDWCEIHIVERDINLGLGVSILTGVSEVIQKHESFIVFEDDLICVPGTYQYMSSSLNYYRDDHCVMSVTGWNHPKITPKDIIDNPYFDGRAESWSWGTWARSWRGMEQNALTLMKTCQRKGIDVHGYGADLPEMARIELKRNIWAVRFIYWHILNNGLCVRPPWSMVEHIGFDSQATNASDGEIWSNPFLNPCPPLPKDWPEPVENPMCSELWQKAIPKQNLSSKLSRKIRRIYSFINNRK